MHLIAIALYFVPAIIAAARHTHNSTAILLLNLFLGWTGVGWIIAFLMAIFSAPDWIHHQYYRRGW